MGLGDTVLGDTVCAGGDGRRGRSRSGGARARAPRITCCWSLCPLALTLRVLLACNSSRLSLASLSPQCSREPARVAAWQMPVALWQAHGNEQEVTQETAGWTELMLAAARRRMPQLLKLLSNSTPLEDRNLDGHTAFALAALHGHVDVMASLVAHKAVLDTFCNAGTTPLMQAAGRGDERVAKWLLENGAAVNMRRGDGRTAIFDATLHAHAGLLKLLLAYSASLHVRARDTSTPLVAAVLGGSACRECAGLLLEAAADVNVRFELTECSVALMRSRSNIRAMHNVATFRVPAGQGEADVTPLMYAAWKGHETTVQRLLAHKADVDARSHSGSSPLLGAVGNGHLGVVALLLEHDADLGQADKNGISPLDEAANLERSDIHKLVQLHAGLADLTMVSRRKFAAQREKRNNSRSRPPHAACLIQTDARPRHRVSRPRGTGSVGDSVGEGGG